MFFFLKLLIISSSFVIMAADDAGGDEKEPLFSSRAGRELITPPPPHTHPSDLQVVLGGAGASSVNRPLYVEQQVLRWLDLGIINKQPLSKCLNNTVLVIESLSGLARGAIYFDLGYLLATDWFAQDIEKPWKEIIAATYGVGTSLPIICLGSNLSGYFLKKMVTPKSQCVRDIEKDSSCGKRILGTLQNIVIVGGAACSASIFTDITYDNFYQYISWGWLVPGIPTFYVRALIDYYALIRLRDNAYDISLQFINKRLSVPQPGSRRANIHEVKQSLRNASLIINSLNYRQAKLLEGVIKDSDAALDVKVRAMVNPCSFLEDEEITIKKSNLFRDLVGYVGGAVGIYGMYLFYNDTYEAFGFTKPVLHLDSHQQQTAQTTLAIISLATASGLSAIASQSSILKFYDMASMLCGKTKNFFKKCFCPHSQPYEEAPLTREDKSLLKKRAASACISALLAACNTTTLYQIAKEESLDMSSYKDVLALSACAVAQFSMCFWGVDELILDVLKAGDPRTAILKCIDQIDRQLPYITDDALRSLREILIRDGGAE